MSNESVVFLTQSFHIVVIKHFSLCYSARLKNGIPCIYLLWEKCMYLYFFFCEHHCKCLLPIPFIFFSIVVLVFFLLICKNSLYVKALDLGLLCNLQIFSQQVLFASWCRLFALMDFQVSGCCFYTVNANLLWSAPELTAVFFFLYIFFSNNKHHKPK